MALKYYRSITFCFHSITHNALIAVQC
jgi:hypothetical protein